MDHKKHFYGLDPLFFLTDTPLDLKEEHVVGVLCAEKDYMEIDFGGFRWHFSRLPLVCLEEFANESE